jgi:hypothetical protein
MPIKRVLKLALTFVFILVCAFVAVASYQLSKYYKNTTELEPFLGLKGQEAVEGTLDPLLQRYYKNRLFVVRSLPPHIETNIDFDESLFNPAGPGKGDWIPYGGEFLDPVNYAKLRRVVNSRQNEPSTGAANPPSTVPSAGAANPPSANNATDVDKYVASKMFERIIGICKDQCRDYAKYNELMWNYLFQDAPRGNVGVGKIYIVSKNKAVLFVYPAVDIPPFPFSERPWWQAAFEKNNTYRDLNGPSLTEKEIDSGITTVYTGIEEQRKVTDLNRTIWFKFKQNDNDYLMAVDIRMAPENSNLFGSVWYTIIPIPLLLLMLPLFSILYLRLCVLTDPVRTRIYKVQRMKKEMVSFNAGVMSKVEFTSSFSTESVKGNRITISGGWEFNLPARVVDARIGWVRSSSRSGRESTLIQVVIQKTFDLTLAVTNLKSVELWKICRPDNEDHTLGVVEVLWQNNRSLNEITFNQVFWDGNTSASYTDILKQLRGHLYTNESDAFLSDQSLPHDQEPNIVTSLKGNLAFVNDFAIKHEAYNNRVLLFDNNVSALGPIYANQAINVFATCSIEFLYNLKRQGQFHEILRQRPNVNRIIIDGEKLKFKEFYEALDGGDKEFILSLGNLRIIGYREFLETIYLNRDFCILSIGPDKCVFYTDMSDPQAQKGWISWRSVDIEYYHAIKEFIESIKVEKITLHAYLGV